MKSSIKKLPQSEVEIELEIPTERLEDFFALALKEKVSLAEIPGFRKGHAPEEMFIQRLGEMNILESATQMAVNEFYPIVLKENKLDVIGSPEIIIKKLARKNPLLVKIKATLLPEIQLGNHRKIAQTEK